jgi:hypothetical protein
MGEVETTHGDEPALGADSQGKSLLDRIDGKLRALIPRAVYRASVKARNQGRVLAGRGPGRGRILPDFLIIGAQKAGTTSLHAWINEHPLVAGSTRKEVDYFSYGYYRGEDWYRKHFPTWREREECVAANGRPFLAGEASPSYLHHPLAPARVARVLPGAKLLVTLRDPIDRAYSSYTMWRGWNLEPVGSFMTACAIEDVALDGGRARAEMRRLGLDNAINFRLDMTRHLGRMYLMGSRYAEQLDRWFAHFPREQIYVTSLDDLSSDPYATLAQVYEFLGLPEYSPPDLAPQFRQSYDPVAPEDRARLREYFRPHNERLYELLGRDFGWDG